MRNASVHVLLARAARMVPGATLLLLLPGSPFLQDASASNWQYLSPSPGAHFVSPENNLVFRDGRDIDASTLAPGLVSVVGSVSGVHDGALTLARDGRSLVFRPSIPFALGETVQATLLPGIRTSNGDPLPQVDLAFEVSKVNPKAQPPVLEEDGNGQPPPQESPAESPADIAADCTALPTGFPAYNVRTYNNPDPGNLFTSPFGPGGNIVMIDNFGQPLFFRHFANTVHDFLPQPNGLLTYFLSRPGDPKFYALDHTFSVVDSFTTGNGYVPDTHELLLLPNGHFLITSYDPQPVAMDQIVPGGDPEATVIGLIIQELDADRNVVFQWRSWDHFQITDAVGVNLTAANIDYCHENSLDLMPDGNLLLSSRHMSEITKIDRQTGDIIWRMGLHAKNNQFTFPNDPRGCSYQHCARWLPNGHLTIFDNGNSLTPAYSRMVEYDVDEVNHVATEVMEWVHSPTISASFLGSVQRLPSGRTLIGWGGAVSLAKLTEINPDGSVSLELGGTASTLSYRAIRGEWRGGLLVAAETMDLGIANPGQTVVRQLPVSNGTSADVTIGCVVSSDPQFAVTTPMPITLPPGGEVMLDVAFTPSGTGPRSGKLYMRVPGATQFVAQDVKVSGLGNRPPDCSQAFATPSSLWPPNHQLMPIAIGGVVDPEGEPVTITVTGIQQDEPLDGVGDGSTCPDAAITAGAAQVRAERSGRGDGRVYELAFRAEDPEGMASTGIATVVVPHDQPAGFGLAEPLTARPEPHDPPSPKPSGTSSYINSIGCPACLDGESNTDFMLTGANPTSGPFALQNLGVIGGRASVGYSLTTEGVARLEVFDLLGRKVKSLVDGHQSAGPHEIEWNTTSLSQGIYFYRLRAGAASTSRVVHIVH